VFLVFDVLPDDFQRCAADSADKIEVPERRQAAFKGWELPAQQPGAAPFQLFDQPVYPKLRVHFHQQMNVVGPHFQLDQVGLKLKRGFCDDFFQASIYPLDQHPAAVFGTPDDVVFAGVDYISVGLE